MEKTGGTDVESGRPAPVSHFRLVFGGGESALQTYRSQNPDLLC